MTLRAGLFSYKKILVRNLFLQMDEPLRKTINHKINIHPNFKTTTMKQISFLKTMLTLGAATFIFSCNSAGTSDTSSTKTDSTAAVKDTTAVTPPAPAGPTVPFEVVIIYHTVKDYDKWRPAFDADSTMRKASGLTVGSLERSVAKPDHVKIVLMISDTAKANAFVNDPRLKDVMKKAGVIGKPERKYWNIVRFHPENSKAGGTVLEIVHKVKDYDTWIKGFDGEGPATRAANGMEDIAIGRGVEDPNLVHIVFEVTDMAKAKARLADPALKKLMKDSGVEGTPTITFYNNVMK
jgi:hypothetical protein